MYAKVFSQMYDGSLCTQGPWQALVTFQQMLVLADQDGVVDMTAEAIARRTTIPLEIIIQGIEELLKPDAKSRTPTEEGRRIIHLSTGRDWGWQVVNYKHYRQLKREEDRREYHRDYWQKRKQSQQSQQSQPSQPIAEAEAEAEAIKPSAAKASPKKIQEETELQAACKQTWQSYSTAYHARYGAYPLRNVRVNSIIKKIVQELGHEEAPGIAAFFVGHNDRYYVQKVHPVQLLLKDAGGLRTQWLTGRTILPANGSNRVQEARLSVVEQIFGGLHHENRRSPKDITTRPAIESHGASISEANIFLREPNAGEVAGD